MSENKNKKIAIGINFLTEKPRLGLPGEYLDLGVNRERTKIVFELAYKLREKSKFVEDAIEAIAKRDDFTIVEKLVCLTNWDSMAYYDENLKNAKWMMLEREEKEEEEPNEY